MKCCEVGISKFRDNVSKSGMSSFSRTFRYMRSPCGRIWSTVWVVDGRTATDWANNKAKKLIKEHCLPLKMLLNRSWLWWILPLTNKDELDIIRYLPNTDEQTELRHAMRDVLPAADHAITRAQNHSDISKSSIENFAGIQTHSTTVAQPQLQD